MNESKKYQHMMINVSRRDYPAVNDMLDVFVEFGYFKRENTTVHYDAENEEHGYDIRDISWETAAFIGEMLEAGVGHKLTWYHHCLFEENV